jgi:type IV pilus assembly protein PilY1
MSDANKAYANSGDRLVSYLRGDRTHEAQSEISATAVPALYRARAHLLGDIINGAPVHVGKPPFSYSDTGYADFVNSNASRKPVVYVSANDGMLHAISAQGTDGGTELWAYVPGAVMSNLYHLADNNYGNNHQYYVDGAPVMGDIKVGDAWKTILVGGLNKGGKSYYALDITDPANPRTLWEFTDDNMGLSYGNPIITKRADGTWIVALTSGFNNSTGDGKGHLYILNANTGEKLMDVVTTAGSATTPSGLSKINAWVDNPADNSALRFYGGDQLGNLWRFDIDDKVEPHRSAMLLAQLKLSATTPQPISAKPMTVEISGKPVVVVATGRYMGDTDITDSTQHSIYAIKDTLTSTGWGDVRNSTQFVQQTLSLNGSEANATEASVSSNSVDWALKGGWRIDLPHARERIFSNMGLQLGTLAIGTAIPSGDACASGGSSWRYYLNVGTGSAVASNPVGVRWSPLALIVGISWIKDTNGNVRIIYQNSDSKILSEVPPTAPSSGSGSVHRTSWRELAD